jgi:hypothetical protein
MNDSLQGSEQVVIKNSKTLAVWKINKHIHNNLKITFFIFMLVWRCTLSCWSRISLICLCGWILVNTPSVYLWWQYWLSVFEIVWQEHGALRSDFLLHSYVICIAQWLTVPHPHRQLLTFCECWSLTYYALLETLLLYLSWPEISMCSQHLISHGPLLIFSLSIVHRNREKKLVGGHFLGLDTRFPVLAASFCSLL